MILKGSQRAGARQLANHLLNDRDNDHVTLLELRGFVAEDLDGALREAQAISKATKCKQYLFSLSLNPPKDFTAGERDFIAAADRAEKALGLDDQPRAIIIHEKEGRRHAHVVWSRIDGAELKAVNLPHYKTRLNELSRELFLEHGWNLPDGLRANGGKSFLNFTLEEWQQAKRIGLDPREIKQTFRDAWERSDGPTALGNALAERGYFLAQGDRRGFVAIDVQGQVFSLSKWAGVRAKDVREKMGPPDPLPSVDEMKAALKIRVTTKLKGFIQETKDKHARDAAPLNRERQNMVAAQRTQRQHLREHQRKRERAETQARADKYRKGLRGLLDRVTGRSKAIREANELDAYRCARRDQDQRDQLVVDQMKERRSLQKQIDALRSRQKQDRKLLARDITQFLRTQERRTETERSRSQERSHEATPHRNRDRYRGPNFDH